MDTERCFAMELDPAVVAPPAAFLVGIERDAEFEVSRVRTAVRAALPPLADAADVSAFATLVRGVTFFLDNCLHRPVYRLHKDDGIISQYLHYFIHHYIL